MKKEKVIIIFGIISVISLVLSTSATLWIISNNSTMGKVNLIINEQTLAVISYDVGSPQDRWEVEGTFRNTGDIQVKDTTIEVKIYSEDNELLGTGYKTYTDISNTDSNGFTVYVDKPTEKPEGGWKSPDRTEFVFHNLYTFPIQ